MSELLGPFLLTLVAGLATGVGGGLAVLRRRLAPVVVAASLGLSAGVMIYVSFVELLPLGQESIAAQVGDDAAGWWAVLAFFGGIGLAALIDRLVPAAINPHEQHGQAGDEEDDVDPEEADRRRHLMRTGVLTAVALFAHNVPEGFAVFLAATQDLSVATAVVAAVAIHNIPEGIAVAVPIAYATGSAWKGFGFALLSGLAEPIGGLVGYVALSAVIGPAALGVSFAAVAGVMVFVSLDELLPAAHAFDVHHAVVYGLVAGMAVMAVSLLALG